MPKAERPPRGERQPEVEHQLGVQPRGRLWPTGESDTEEEDETAEWPACRTAATFERHKRFADLDARAPRRQAFEKYTFLQKRLETYSSLRAKIEYARRWGGH